MSLLRTPDWHALASYAPAVAAISGISVEISSVGVFDHGALASVRAAACIELWPPGETLDPAFALTTGITFGTIVFAISITGRACAAE